MRVVLDTNLFVSAFISPNGNAAAIVAAAVRRRITVCSSQPLSAEVHEVFTRDHLRRIAHAQGRPIEAFLSSIRFAFVMVEIDSIPPVLLADPDDDKVLATALAAKADFIVTGAAELLKLGRYESIQIVSLKEFLARLG